ncbi:MAG: choice-of-anchor J domain-containing protein [Ignavibacteria bacterium]|nr:choice-of-anchor J domain-containing protein [Ignavibacteria bacterium]
MKKAFPILAVFAIGVFFLGLIWSDPFNSKTSGTTETDAIQPTVPYTNAIVKYVDSLNGANDTVALRTRGYKPKRGPAGGPAGTSPNWFQGNSTVFAAFNGPATGYVAANFNNVTGTNPIDLWLISPVVNGASGDTLSFYERGPTGSTFPDSIRVYWASNGDTVPGSGSWVELGRFKTTLTGSWAERRFTLPSAGANGRFAINYRVVNGGPSGVNSDFIGIDFIRLLGPSGPPPAPNYYSSNWCPANTYPSLPAATFYQESAWLGDTLFVHTPDATGLATTTIRRYTLGGTWTVGVPLPVAKAGGTLTAAGGKLYYIGGGASVTTGSTDIYEYSAGVWTLKAPGPLAVSGHATVNWGDSVLFVTGGPWASGTTTVNFYRIGSNTWGSSTPFATGRRSHAAGLSGNKIFIAGGFPFTNSFQIGTIGSNASTITWAAGPNIPVPAAITGLSRIGGFAIGNAFYTVGGERGGATGYHDSVHVWSITANAWVRVISGKPGGGMSNIFAAVTGRVVNDTAKIFLPGGYNGTGQAQFDVIGCGPNIFTGLTPINSEIPNKFNLLQNYPNPFNPITNIKFAIPTTGLVKLTVFDILGREVATLLNEVKPAGNYLVDYDASALSSGVYFYRLEAGDFTDTKKMLLVK